MTEGPDRSVEPLVLARAYRWCFRAYPRSYLAEHGHDVMALVAEVHAGERHVSVRECRSIVRAGLERRLRLGRLRYWLPAVLLLEAAGALLFVAWGVLALLEQHVYPSSIPVGFTTTLEVDVTRAVTYLAPLLVLAAALGWRALALTRAVRTGTSEPLHGLDLAVVATQPFLLLGVAVAVRAIGAPAVYPSFAVAAQLVVPAAIGILFVRVAALWRSVRWSSVGILGAVGVLALVGLPSWAAGISSGGDASSWWAPTVSGATSLAVGFTNQIAVPDGQTLPTAVDCPTLTQCYAFGWGALPLTFGDHSLNTFAESGNGGAWLAEPFPAALFDDNSGLDSQLSCPTRLRCFVVGQPVQGQAWEVAVTSNAGSSWKLTAPLPAATSVGPPRLVCPGVDTCVFLTDAGITVTHDAGSNWREVVRFGGASTEVLGGLSCVRPLQCAALVSSFDGSRIVYTFLSTSDGGTSWQRRVVNARHFAVSSLTCPTPLRCIADGLPNVGLWITSDAGRSWSRIQAPALGSITCPTTTTCWAIAGTTVMRSDTAGGTWHAVAPLGAGWGVEAMSCPAANECTVAGNRGGSHLDPFIATTDNGGRSWTRVTFPRLPRRDLPAPRSLF